MVACQGKAPIEEINLGNWLFYNLLALLVRHVLNVMTVIHVVAGKFIWQTANLFS